MYNSYFGLKETPFSLTPDPRYLYFSPNHREAINHLLYGINERKGFILITGSIGAGKTTVCRVLLDQLDKNTKSALILNSFISDMELLKVIVQEFRINVSTESDSKKDYIDALNSFLLENYSNGGNAALLIDEAQNLTRDVLEQLRMISNLETEKEKLIQIVLIGQPELRDIISSPSLRQLNERIVVSYNLMPLDFKDVKGYVEHRLVVAGGLGNLSFSPRGFKKLYRFSKGIPRRINSLCDRALLIAYTNDLRVISGSIIEKAANDLYDFKDWRDPFDNWTKTKYVMPFILVMLLIFFIVFTGLSFNKFLFKQNNDRTEKVNNVTPDSPEIIREIKDTKKVIDVFLNEKESINALFSQFYISEKSSTVYEDQRALSIVTYRLSPEYFVMLKKPFRVTAIEKSGIPKYLTVINGDDEGATCLDAQGEKREVSRSFLFEHWGDTVSWIYPDDGKNRILNRGMDNPRVLKLQESLKNIGYIIEVTGIYDDSTYKAVKQFQKEFGLNPDGVTGPRTMAILYQMAG